MKLQLRGGSSGKGPHAMLSSHSPAVALFSPAAQLPWGQPAGCQSRHQSPQESPVHPWALALETGKGGSVHTPGPGDSHIETGKAELLVWAGSWLWEKEWAQDHSVSPGPPVLSRSPWCILLSTLWLWSLAFCSIFCFLSSPPPIDYCCSLGYSSCSFLPSPFFLSQIFLPQ